MHCVQLPVVLGFSGIGQPPLFGEIEDSRDVGSVLLGPYASKRRKKETESGRGEVGSRSPGRLPARIPRRRKSEKPEKGKTYDSAGQWEKMEGGILLQDYLGAFLERPPVTHEAREEPPGFDLVAAQTAVSVDVGEREARRTGTPFFARSSNRSGHSTWRPNLPFQHFVRYLDPMLDLPFPRWSWCLTHRFKRIYDFQERTVQTSEGSDESFGVLLGAPAPNEVGEASSFQATLLRGAFRTSPWYGRNSVWTFDPQDAG
ncbi:hypothetical protein KM043_014587 [Ampulex compressa]|nr:hypothetical protein KM043_014587 [Ampulex compressa]